MTEYGITSKGVMRTLVWRTALGYNWYPGHPGGSLPYLNASKEERLLHLIESACQEQESHSAVEVTKLALELRQEMMLEARSALIKRRCTTLASKIHNNIFPPSSSWLHGFCRRHGLQTTNARFVERERTWACNRSVITEYWLRFLPYFNRDPRLIFGADETDMRPGSRFKVVTPSGHPGFTHDEEVAKHITAMCAHSAGGASVPPFILLSQLVKLPQDLAAPEICSPDVAWFASSDKGYMTEKTFYIWTCMFLAWLSGYRASVLPDCLKQANILLVMDGCLAHGAPEALHLFAKHNVTVLILPAHTTHLLQPFDVVLAGPLKAAFRHYVAEEKAKLRDVPLTGAARSRSILVRAFIHAWRSVATPGACARSFEAVGIFPISPFVVLESPFVTDTTTSEADKNLNMKLVTDPGVMQLLDSQLKRPRFPEASHPVDLGGESNVINFFRSGDHGRLLSGMPTLFWVDGQGRWSVVSRNVSSPITPVRPDVLLAIMKRLTIDAQKDGEEILHFQSEQDQAASNLRGHVVRTAALQLSKEIALNLAVERIQTIEHLLSEKVATDVRQCILARLEEAEIAPTTRDVILENVNECSILAIHGALHLLTDNSA